MLFALLFSSLVFARDFDEIHARNEQYRQSEAYRSRVQAFDEARRAEQLRDFNAKTLSETEAFATKLHKGKLRPLDYTFNEDGVIVDVDIHCRDGLSCRCNQRLWRLYCDCEDRITRQPRKLQFKSIPAPIEKGVY